MSEKSRGFGFGGRTPANDAARPEERRQSPQPAPSEQFPPLRQQPHHTNYSQPPRSEEEELAYKYHPARKNKPREYRVSTKIHDEYGDLLEDMRRLIRKETGRNPGIGEVIEYALQALEEKKMGG